jgi:hypothetical protein
MAQPANLYDGYSVVGAKEDISDLIHNIAPTETPTVSMIGSTEATQRFHQWQTDTLAAPNGANAAVEGNEAALEAQTASVLVGNYTQISTKTFGVSGTLEVTEKYGRDSSLAYAAAKAARELKTDVDAGITGVNQASLAGDSTTARKSGSLETWIETNIDEATDSSGGGFSSGVTVVRTDGTARAFAQTQLDGVIQAAWGNGARPSVILLGGYQKANLSSFDGVGARRTDASGRTIFATADLYVSNFGELRVVPSRHIRESTAAVPIDQNVFVLDPEYLKVAYLRPWQQYDLAKTGDSIRRQMLVEWTLEVCNEKAHGLVADLDNS